MKQLFEIDCSFSSLHNSLCFDFKFDVIATDEKEARLEAWQLLRNSKIHEVNHITINSVEKSV